MYNYYSRELHDLLKDMEKFAKENKVPEINTITLLYELMIDPKFAKAVLLSTNTPLREVEQNILDLAETWSEEDENGAQNNRVLEYYIQNNTKVLLKSHISGDLKVILKLAERISIDNGGREVGIDDVVEAMLARKNSNIEYFFLQSEIKEETFKRNYKSLYFKSENWTNTSEFIAIIAFPKRWY